MMKVRAGVVERAESEIEAGEGAADILALGRAGLAAPHARSGDSPSTDFQSLAAAKEEASRQIARSMMDGALPPEPALGLMCLAERLHHVGEQAMEVANQVNHMAGPARG